MTDHALHDLDEEREIDLRRWVDALLSRWWIMVLGLVTNGRWAQQTAARTAARYEAADQRTPAMTR